MFRKNVITPPRLAYAIKKLFQGRGILLRRFHGIKRGALHGAIYSPTFPDVRFNVELIDDSGQSIASAIANGPLSKPCQDIPEGCGFSIPLPMLWLARTSQTIHFRFNIQELGLQFPTQGRCISKERIQKLARKYIKLSEQPDITIAREVLSDLETVRAPLSCIIAVHEMSRTGAPLIALELARELSKTYGLIPLILCLGPSGPLSDEFSACSKIIYDCSTALKLLPKEFRAALQRLRENGAHGSALINSMCSYPLAEVCTSAGFRVVSLVHEYPNMFDPDHIQRMFNASAKMIFPCADVQHSFADYAHSTKTSEYLDVIQPYVILAQGCRLLTQSPPDADIVESLHARWNSQLPAHTHVILGCGSVDHRKGFDFFTKLIISHKQAATEDVKPVFVWLGRISDTLIFQQCMDDLKQAGVADQFLYLGELCDPRPAFEFADALLLCSRLDPFPCVVIESLSQGLPVLGFDRWQGCASLIDAQGFGDVVPWMDIKATSAAINRLLENHELINHVESYGPKYISTHFQPDAYASKIASSLQLSESAPVATFALDLV